MLQSVFEAGTSNVVVASVMALLVFAVTRFWKNPHIAHTLWLLVLAKLVTPPLWHVSISLPHVLSEFTWSGDASTRNEEQFVTSGRELAELAQMKGRHAHSTVDTSAAPHEAIRERLSAFIQDAPDRVSWWLAIPVSLWIGGSLVWITVLGTRLVYFNRLLSQTLPATAEMKRIAEMVAKKLALRRLPDLRLTEAAVSPMVWPAVYRPMVVLPQQLVDGMGSDQLSTIIAHEFCHLRRADHWVRFLEVIVVSLYWWNPIVWWVRCELHAAEETCCDALVLRLYPDRLAAYGEALLCTNEFVMSGQVPAPVLASGFGHSCSLKRRVEMILKNEFGQPASQLVRLMIAAIAIGVLPMAARVALAQDTLRQNSGAEATDPSDRLNNSNSLEQRVDQIETLLKQLIKTQESKSESAQTPGLVPATTVVQPSPKKHVEAIFSRVRAVESAETFGRVPATTVRQPVVLEVSDGEGGTIVLDVPDGAEGTTQDRFPHRPIFSVKLTGEKVTDDVLQTIGDLKGLNSLDLSDTLTTDAGLRHLRHLTELQELRLTNCPITDAGLQHLYGMKRLEFVSLPGTNGQKSLGVSEQGVEELQTQLPKLRITVTPTQSEVRLRRAQTNK